MGTHLGGAYRLHEDFAAGSKILHNQLIDSVKRGRADAVSGSYAMLKREVQVPGVAIL